MEDIPLPSSLSPKGSPPVPRPRPASHFTNTTPTISNDSINTDTINTDTTSSDTITRTPPIPAPRPRKEIVQENINTFIPTEQLKEYVSFIVVDNSNMYYGAKNMFSPGNVPYIDQFVKAIEQNKWALERFVASSGLNPQIIKSWEHCMYKVENCTSKGPEYGVDAVLHSKIRHLIRTNPNPTKSILVLVTGDGNRNSCSTSFPDEVLDAIEKGWHVMIYSWKLYTSRHFKDIKKTYPSMMDIIYFDDIFNIHTPSNPTKQIQPRDSIRPERKPAACAAAAQPVLQPVIQEPIQNDNTNIIDVELTTDIYEYTCGNFGKNLESMCKQLGCNMMRLPSEYKISFTYNPSVEKKLEDYIHSTLDKVIVRNITVPIVCDEQIEYSEIATMFAASIKYYLFKGKYDTNTRNDLEFGIIKVFPENDTFKIKVIGLSHIVDIIYNVLSTKGDWVLYTHFVPTAPKIISHLFRNGAEVFHSICEGNLQKFIKVKQTPPGCPYPGLTVRSFIKEKMDMFLHKMSNL